MTGLRSAIGGARRRWRAPPVILIGGVAAMVVVALVVGTRASQGRSLGPFAGYVRHALGAPEYTPYEN